MTGEYFCRGIVSMRSWIIYCFNVIEFNNLVVVVKAAVADYGRVFLMLLYDFVGFIWWGAQLRKCVLRA